MIPAPNLSLSEKPIVVIDAASSSSTNSGTQTEAVNKLTLNTVRFKIIG